MYRSIVSYQPCLTLRWVDPEIRLHLAGEMCARGAGTRACARALNHRCNACLEPRHRRCSLSTPPSSEMSQSKSISLLSSSRSLSPTSASS
eukprot:9474329-Pyramimonas_sp.AAC.1